MEELKLEHLAPYLPYGLKGVWNIGTGDVFCTLTSVINGEPSWKCDEPRYVSRGKHTKPILRPLSDLTKEIKVEEGRFFPLNKIKNFYGWSYLWDVTHNGLEYNVMRIPKASLDKLLEWHFDVFGLIDKGLAVDANELYNEKLNK